MTKIIFDSKIAKRLVDMGNKLVCRKIDLKDRSRYIYIFMYNNKLVRDFTAINNDLKNRY